MVNVNGLTTVQARAMIGLLKKPLAPEVPRGALKAIRRHYLPNAENRTTLKLFHELGYIKIPSHDLEAFEGNALLILKALQANPIASNEEIMSTTYLTNPTQILRQIYKRVGFVACNPRFRRLEFYDYMGWLDRDAMRQDARALDVNVTPTLFPATATESQVRILYELYKNPLGSRRSITNAAHCAIDTYAQTLQRCQGHISRELWFDSLGYIKITLRGTFRSSNKRLDKILRDWREHPGTTYNETADRLGLTPTSVIEYQKQIYKILGYKATKFSRAYGRLGLYWYMGWFDLPRLQEDAQKAYKELK